MASTIASAVVGECDFLNRRSAPRSSSRWWPTPVLASVNPSVLCTCAPNSSSMRSRPMSPDPAATNALQERLGGQFDEMRTSHVELIGTTISRLLDGSPGYNGKKTDPVDKPGEGATPLKITLDTSNIHHYLVGAQGALPVDAAGNPGADPMCTTVATSGAAGPGGPRGGDRTECRGREQHAMGGSDGSADVPVVLGVGLHDGSGIPAEAQKFSVEKFGETVHGCGDERTRHPCVRL